MKEFTIKQLEGKTIKSIEVVSAEYGRTYNFYTCFVCEDGTKILIADGCSEPYSPNIQVEEMKKAPKYFSPEDIANRVLEIEKKQRQAQEDIRKRKLNEYRRLGKELGIKAEQ
jgi:uncharacterized Fe-S cluster-containing radical SAM superfamily protein